MDFRITGLSRAPFEALFAMTDEELAAQGAVRRIADSKPGFPCRVSLQDAEPGEELILLHYEHHSAPTPYRASHAIYIRADARETFDRTNEVPGALRLRMLSVRAFDAQGMMIDADLVDGQDLERAIERLFSDSRAACLHIHFARTGCYAARVERAGEQSRSQPAPAAS
jgi:hypothetical protein